MSLQVQHPVADWYLGFDDLWELMRVNWHTHNTFTQAGMWSAGEYDVLGISLIVDRPPGRAVLLNVLTKEGDEDYLVVVTYGPKCNECGYQPYNALSYGGDAPDEALIWATSVIIDMLNNANENGIEKLHEESCSCLRYPEEDGESTVDDDE